MLTKVLIAAYLRPKMLNSFSPEVHIVKPRNIQLLFGFAYTNNELEVKFIWTTFLFN